MSDKREKRRAIVRTVFGNGQMLAAVVAIVLLWRVGVCSASVIATAVAGALLVSSFYNPYSFVIAGPNFEFLQRDATAAPLPTTACAGVGLLGGLGLLGLARRRRPSVA